ncbi:MAG: inorganic pyrophosphatase, partial [Parcubacteria group bacterium SW_4_46_8]
PVDVPRWDDVVDIDDVHDHTIKEIEHFFRTYKDLQDDAIQVEGFDGEDEAKAAFKRARQLYEQTFSDTQ